MKNSPRAFTLIELLVVVAIAGILAAIAFPIVGKALERSSTAADLSNMRQIGQALALFANENNNRWPHISMLIVGTSLGADQPDRTNAMELIDRMLPPDQNYNKSSIYNWKRRPVWYSKTFAKMPPGKSFDRNISHYWGAAYGMNYNLFNTSSVPPSMLEFGGYINKVPNLSKLVLVGERNRQDGSFFVPGRLPSFGKNIETEYRISRDGKALYMFGDYHIELIEGDQSSARNPRLMKYDPENRLYYAW